MTNFIDYDHKNYIYAHGKEKEFLGLCVLEHPRERFDGSLAHYGLDTRWLSVRCEHENDQAWACVKGSDYILLTEKDFREVEDVINSGGSLFDCFNLW